MARGKLGDWCNIGDAHVDLQTKRFRAPPGVTLVKLLELASLRLWRLCLFGAVVPLDRLVEAKLRDKLDRAVTLGWQEIARLRPCRQGFRSMVS